MGCDTTSFIPFDINDPKIFAVRESLGISPDQGMILTVGGDAASKGAQEVMQAYEESYHFRETNKLRDSINQTATK